MTQPVKEWIVELSCCGRDDGTWPAATWAEADAFREAYTSGPGVDKHGYSAVGYSGHQRAAILHHFPLNRSC